MSTVAAPAPHISHLGEPIWYGNGLFEFLVPTAATGGKMTVFRTTAPEGFSPPRHIHPGHDEVFLIEEGQVDFWIDGERRAAGPGTAVWMPRGVPHTFRVMSGTARILGVMTPGDFEGIFRELGIPAGARALPPEGVVPFDVPRVMAAQRAHGTEVIGPPLEA